jgi:hypothetical protein
MRFVGFIFFVAANLLALNAIAQEEEQKKVIADEVGVRGNIGFLMAHHGQLQYLVQSHAKTVEVYAEKSMSGNKDWHHAYRIPVVGLEIMFADLGNPTDLGYAFSTTAYVKNHLVHRPKFELNSRLAGGFGWLTERFDRIENNKNSAIAGRLNVNLILGIDAEYKFKKSDLGIGINFIHYSNGAFKTPNLGLNFPTISLNYGYKLQSENRQYKSKASLEKWNTQNYLEVNGAFGWKEIMPTNGPKYFVGTTQMLYRRQYSYKSSFLGFAELNYNPSYTVSYENWYKKDVSKSTAFRSGVGIGYGIMYGNFMLFIEKGFYVMDKLNYDGSFFHRIGGHYYFTNGFMANLSLRTHFAKADMVELGIGWSWKMKKRKKSNE